MSKKLTKDKRHTDKDLLEFIRDLPCICCGKSPVDPHHITTVKAGGGDYATNVMPLCRIHHIENHKIGYSRMIKKYESFMQWLILAKRDDVLKRRSK